MSNQNNSATPASSGTPAGSTADNNQAAAETIRSLITRTREVIAFLEGELGAAVLDGTPFLLTCEHEGRQMVYGDFPFIGEQPRKVCFRAAEIVPAHLCGAHLFGPDSANRAILQLAEEGIVARRVHRREFQTAELAKCKADLVSFEAMSAQLGGAPVITLPPRCERNEKCNLAPGHDGPCQQVKRTGNVIL